MTALLAILCLGAAPGSAMNELWNFLDQRLATPRDAERIDTELRKRFEKPLAVMITDMSGFTSRTKKRGIIGFLAQIRKVQQLAKPVLDKHSAILIKADADDLFVVHPEPQALWQVAHELLAAIKKYDEDSKDDIGLAVGLDAGPVLQIGDEDMFGSAVNVASKLGEDMAQGGEILISVEFHDALGKAGVAMDCKLEEAGARGSKFPFYVCK